MEKLSDFMKHELATILCSNMTCPRRGDFPKCYDLDVHDCSLREGHRCEVNIIAEKSIALSVRKK